jgi:hypothetical protein
MEWLSNRNIPYDCHLTKPEIYDIIKEQKIMYPPKYKLDAVLQEHGHKVLRLPPYHPDFNPIEKIWDNVKGWTATRNVTCNLNDVENLARERFGQITTDDWIHVCTHARYWEEKFRQLEHLFDEAVDTLQFQVNTGSSDEDCSDNNSSGSDLSGIELLDAP